MDPIALLVVALLLVVFGVAVSVCRDGPGILPNMFRYRGPEWPRGVQEDDDVRFVWRRPRPDPTRPVVEEVHGRVRPAR